jgi:uncharacterized protein
VTASKASAMYVGSIRHRRYFPHANSFKYDIYMSYLDVDEITDLYRGRWFWSVCGRNLVEYRRRDFFGDSSLSVKEAIWRAVADKTGTRADGPVRLLTHLRYFGLSFNPVSFYYCFMPDGVTLHSIVAEITNTPWGERHAYVLPVALAQPHASALHWEFEKAFHVSPFLPMQMHYSWRFQPPTQALRVHMNVHAAADQALQFDTTLSLQRVEITGRSLALALLRFPFITFGVMWKIYWQALKIWCKRNPFFSHPKMG